MPGLTGIPFQTLEVPFAAGLRTKDDPRALQPPGLSIAQNVEFDDLGALRTRKPFNSIGVNILGGGTLANIRRVFEYGSELCCLTDTALYSWDARDSAWIFRGTHLAVAASETTRFATTDDQIDSDRAELNNTIVFAWVGGTTVYAAAIDKTTGAVIVGPTAQTASGSRPRLVACATKILLFYLDGGNLAVKAIDPANVGTSLAAAATSLAILAASSYYDVTRVIGADQVVGACRRSPTTAYTVFTVTAGLVSAAAAPARTCDGPIAVSSTPDGAHVQVVRANGTAIQGDLITISTLADVFTGQAIGTAPGTPINQIAAAHRSVQNGGQYRCYAFWSSQENPANTTAATIQSNWVDTGNTLGVASQLVAWCGVGSRAFDYNGSVYFWATFGQTSGLGSGGANATATGNFQNAYYLFRDDGFRCGKACYPRGGGLSPSTGRLPGVALTSGTTTFSWCATIRRILQVGQGTSGNAKAPTSSGYSDRSPQDVTFTFDSNDARRVVQLGNTIYMGGAEVLQYDGVQLVELDFPVYPWFFDALIAGPGNIANGTYGYKSTYRWQNAKGEVDRSSTALVANATMSGGPSGFSIQPVSCPITRKPAPTIEIWRTEVNPPESPPYYLVTSLDPTVTSGANCYVPSVASVPFPSAFDDQESDGAASINAESPDNDGTLPSIAPPGASVIMATDDRIFLGGVAGDQDAIWYSKQRDEGEVASFFGTLRVALPAGGGAVAALALVEETPVVFRQRAIFTLRGDGFDNTGGGTNYEPVRVSSDVGAVNGDAIGVGPFGAIFKSSKGWYILPPDLVEPKYIGDKVSKFDGDTVLAVHVMESQHQVRCLTNARMLVWDYWVNEWSEWTITDGAHACMWNGSHLYASSSAVKQQATDFTGIDYGWDVEMAFFKPPGLMGRMTVLKFQVLGECRAAYSVRIRCARDYQQDGAGNWSYYDDTTWIGTPATVGGPLQVQHGPSKKQCEAIKVRLTSLAPDGISQPTAESPKLTAIAFRFGVEDGLYSQLPAGQKT